MFLSKRKRDKFYIEKEATRLSSLLYLCIFVASIISAFLTFIFGFFSGNEYSLIFLLPLSYLFLLCTGKNLFIKEANGIGILVFFVADFIRLVFVPLFVVLGFFTDIISLNTSENTPLAILIMTYEAIWIGLFFRVKKNKLLLHPSPEIDDKNSNVKMNFLVLFVVLFAFLFNFLAPEIIQNYRTIVDIVTQQYATSLEQSKIIEIYGTSFTKKISLVLANYYFKVARLLLPIYLLVFFRNKFNGQLKVLSLMIVISPMLIIDGSVGTSFHYTFILLVLFCLLYNKSLKDIYKPLIFLGLCVIIYFILRSSFSEYNMLDYIVEVLMAYFSGVNIVSGAFNLPPNLSYRIHYFIRDILGSIPFSTTLFGYSGPSIQAFFNQYNRCLGQIAPSIGLGYYYFSPLFCPLYSVFFINLCIKNGIKYREEENVYYKVIYLFISYFSALAITAYNIEIVFGLFFQVLFPIYIIIRIAYRKDVKTQMFYEE